MNTSLNSFAEFISGSGVMWVLAIGVLTAVVHVAFAIAVLIDAGNLERLFRRRTFFVGGLLWALATLLGGVIVAAIYWLMHHSTLGFWRPPRRSDAEDPAPHPTPVAHDPQNY
jgi:hypothetical protein